MSLEAVTELVSASPWTYGLILAVAALDALVPLVPSETTVIAAGVIAGLGELQIGFVIAAAAAGAYAGDTSAYWLGRLLEHRLERRLFRGAQGTRRREWAERALARYGGALIFGARFVPGGRTATTVTAGLLRMRWPLFAAFAVAAAAAWASYAALIGYLGGRAFESNPLWGLLLGFGIAAATYLVVAALRSRSADYRTQRCRAASTRYSSSLDERAGRVPSSRASIVSRRTRRSCPFRHRSSRPRSTAAGRRGSSRSTARGTSG